MSMLRKILDIVSEILIEREYEISLLIATLLSSGHALMEGVPGIAKTLTAKTIARLFDLEFKRISLNRNSAFIRSCSYGGCSRYCKDSYC